MQKEDTKRDGWEERENQKFIKALKSAIQSLSLKNLIFAMKVCLAHVFVACIQKGKKWVHLFKETLKDGATLYMYARTVGLKCCGEHWYVLKCGFILSYVPCTLMCFVYSVYIIPILSDITNVLLKYAFVVLIWFWLTKFEMKGTCLNRPVQIPS